MQTIQIKKGLKIELDDLVSSVSELDERALNEFFEKLNQRIAHPEAQIARHKQEIVLLKQIRSMIPSSVVRRFKILQKKQHQFTITAQETAEMLFITDFIEIKSAERVYLLGALAKLRQIPLPELVKQLDLKNFHA
jgi:hypothetical protein